MTTFQADLVETQYVDGASARFAYRRLGPRSGVPLILCLRLRGTIDHWDPALLDVLASERDVIVFDNRGTGRSSGTAPDTIDGLADGLLEFIDALGLSQVDLLGWSMGRLCRPDCDAASPDPGAPADRRRLRTRQSPRHACCPGQGLADRRQAGQRR